MSSVLNEKFEEVLQIDQDLCQVVNDLTWLIKNKQMKNDPIPDHCFQPTGSTVEGGAIAR